MQDKDVALGFLVKRERFENSKISFKLCGKIGPQKNHAKMRDTVSQQNRTAGKF